MYRDIKFRGLRTDGKGWIRGSLLIKNEQYFIVSLVKVKLRRFGKIREEYREFEVTPLSVGQFTGLTDKNGKEIYEGDKLYSTGYLCVVIWLNGCFRTVYNHPEDGETLILGEDIDHSNMEVIGNIHEK